MVLSLETIYDWLSDVLPIKKKVPYTKPDYAIPQATLSELEILCNKLERQSGRKFQIQINECGKDNIFIKPFSNRAFVVLLYEEEVANLKIYDKLKILEDTFDNYGDLVKHIDLCNVKINNSYDNYCYKISFSESKCKLFLQIEDKKEKYEIAYVDFL
jgi:hypothetical protein